MSGLTVENFVERIKNMDERERNKLRAPDLIKLIVELPVNTPNTDMMKKMDNLVSLVSSIDSRLIKTWKKSRSLKL